MEAVPAIPDAARGRPFQPTTDPHTLWPGTCHREALEQLLAGVRAGDRLLVLTGDVGTGKTIVANALAERLRQEGAVVGRVDYPNAEPSEFLQSAAAALGLGEVVEPWDVFRQIARLVATAGADGRRVVLVVEEAQSLAAGLLTEVGRLAAVEGPADAAAPGDPTRRGGPGIVLVGGEPLESNLASHRSLAGAVGTRCVLRPLRGEEVRDYVEHRLAVAGLGRDTFTPLALRLVGESSGGVPRLINTLCDHALADAGRRGLPVVDSELMQACIQEVAPRGLSARPPAAGAAVLAPGSAGRGEGRPSWAPGLVAIAVGVGVVGLVAGYLVRGPRPGEHVASTESARSLTAPAPPVEPAVRGPVTEESTALPAGDGLPGPQAGSTAEASGERAAAPARARTPDDMSLPPLRATPTIGRQPSGRAPGATDTAAPPARPGSPEPPARPVPSARAERAAEPGVQADDRRPPGSAESSAAATSREPAARGSGVEPRAERLTRPPGAAADAEPARSSGPGPGARRDDGPDPTSIIDWLFQESPRRLE